MDCCGLSSTGLNDINTNNITSKIVDKTEMYIRFLDLFKLENVKLYLV